MHALGANRAVMITTGRYTSAAREWARDKTIDLWGPEQLGAPASPPSVGAPDLSLEPTASLGTCPQSQSQLVARTNRRTGEKFVGCSDYPTCTYTRPL